MEKLYTVTEIAESICRADGLRLNDHSTAHSQVRNAVRRGFLQGGVQVDARGTQAFPASEIYRARLLNALADLSIDIAFMKDAIGIAEREAPLEGAWPDRMRFDGGRLSKGGFLDAVEGVAAGESWSFVVKLYRPGLIAEKRVVAAFAWDDADAQFRDDAGVEELTGVGRPQAVLTLNLTDLFKKLPPLSF